MKISDLLIPIFIFYCQSSAQFIEESFPAPSDNITGLAYAPLGVFALDPVEGVVYEVHESGAVLDTIPLPFTFHPAVGLAWTGSPESDSDTLWFAEAGTPLIHFVDGYGTMLATYDFQESGVQCISGLEIGPDYSNPPNWALFFIDSATQIIYEVKLPIGSEAIQQYIDIENCPDVFDIASPRAEWGCIPVACSDPISPVRCYYDSESYIPLGGGSYESAVGVATAGTGVRFYFSDPEMGLIHRYCMNMGGIEDDGSGVLSFATIFPNPSTGAATIELALIAEALVGVSVYDISGRLVLRTPEVFCPPGPNELGIEGLDPGIFLLRIATPSQTMALSLIVLGS